jgi:hypothetical protein
MWGKDSLKHLKRVVVQARAKGLVGEPVYRYAITDARFFADTREDAGEPIAAMGFRLIANKLEGGNYPAGVFHAVEIPTSFDR